MCAILAGSGTGDSPHDRWSYFPAAPTRLLVCDADGRGTSRDAAGVIATFDSPTAALDFLDPGHAGPVAAMSADAPPFTGGWVGCLSYDLGRFFELMPSLATDDRRWPPMAFTFHPRSIALDHHTGRWYETVCQSPHDGDPIAAADRFDLQSPGPMTPTHTPEQYRAAVARVIEYIRAGDIFQVNLSQRFTAPLTESPAALFQRARRVAPARYGAYLSYGDRALVGNSPELFLKVDPTPGGRRVTTRPIKGTRPRGAGMRAALRDSVKDQAELNMIVDLERNDLGRVCRIGSVRVTEPRVIETHPTVHHGAATIEGILRDDVGLADLLAATFPGGSVTGAPKIRAMQIIEELEAFRRGPYCGAVGFISSSGSMAFNLAIRTLVISAGRVDLQVGGGIVADSDPESERLETLVKARQMEMALGK